MCSLELGAEVGRQSIDHFGAPSVPLLALKDIPANPPVETDQPGIDRQRGAQPGFPDPGLQIGEPIAVARWQARQLFRHDILMGNEHVPRHGWSQ